MGREHHLRPGPFHPNSTKAPPSAPGARTVSKSFLPRQAPPFSFLLLTYMHSHPKSCPGSARFQSARKLALRSGLSSRVNSLGAAHSIRSQAAPDNVRCRSARKLTSRSGPSSRVNSLGATHSALPSRAGQCPVSVRGGQCPLPGREKLGIEEQPFFPRKQPGCGT